METQAAGKSNSVTTSLCASKGYDEGCEASLILEAKAGSRTAFDQLVQRHKARVSRVAQSMARTPEDAEEIVQNAFFKAFENLSRFRGDSRFYTWLVRITINEALMKMRGRRFSIVSIDDPVNTKEGAFVRELEDRRPTPEERCSHEELRNILATSIRQLRPRYRTVFQLREVVGLSTEETAQALHLSRTTVKSRLWRARITLRNSLDKFARRGYSKPTPGSRSWLPLGAQSGARN